jgi:ketosteroid isomerase-like protein
MSQHRTHLKENEMRTMRARWVIVAILPLLVLGNVARADDIRLAMESANTKFLAAFNAPNPSAFLPLYTTDSVLFFQGAAPVTGPEAIKQFWESRIKIGARDHTFEIIETGADGNYAYQVSRATIQLVRDNGEKTLNSGHTVRIFEKQSDGTWKTKIHMYNRPN